jgi:LacI family transcriptional regulator
MSVARPQPPDGQSGTQRVALLIETSLASGRDILLGVARYVRGHQPWLLYHEPRGLEDNLPDWIGTWQGDGIIARIQTPAMADALLKTKLPVVDALGVVPNTGFPLIGSDNDAIGRMAAEHLAELGLRNFAFLGIENEYWSEAREKSFVASLSKKEFDVSVRREHRHDADRLTWEVYQTRLVEWILTLSLPIGVMVCSDQRCTAFLNACHRAKRAVPDDIAVIGVDNDEPLCGVCNPALTSVWPDHESIGYEAAVLLQRMMDGEKRLPSRTVLPPKFVVTRKSTDTLTVEDPVVFNSLRLIRKHACERIDVDTIADRVGVSRSVLQRRFRSVLGRTINEELVARRLKTAQDLLLNTKLSLAEIARRTGFQHQEYMGAVFKSHLGMTPAVFRKRSQKVAN